MGIFFGKECRLWSDGDVGAFERGGESGGGGGLGYLCSLLRPVYHG